MIKVNVSEAKARLSALLELARQGRRVQICIRNVPAVELRPLGAGRRKSGRPIGRCAGRIRIPDSFFDPLPDGVVEGFESPA